MDIEISALALSLLSGKGTKLDQYRLESLSFFQQNKNYGVWCEKLFVQNIGLVSTV